MTSKPPRKIMIIDDDPDFVDAVGMILKSAGYEVASVLDPKQAKDRALAEKPDLIILDIMMDGLFDGFSLCNELKSGPECREVNAIPIVFCSSIKQLSGSRFDVRGEAEGFKGPEAYLDKPVKCEDLLATLDRLLPK